jgi:hypothetical protein
MPAGHGVAEQGGDRATGADDVAGATTPARDSETTLFDNTLHLDLSLLTLWLRTLENNAYDQQVRRD